MGDYLSSKAEVDFHKAERDREEWEIDNSLEGEKQEMIDLYTKRGLPPQDAVDMVNLMSKHKQFFVDMMMIEELSIMPPDPTESPAKKGVE
jgi:hypothetical protein